MIVMTENWQNNGMGEIDLVTQPQAILYKFIFIHYHLK